MKDLLFIDTKVGGNKFQDKSFSKDDLQSIISSITWESPFSDSLYKGKFVFFLLESLQLWQKPLGEYFHSTYAVCAVKPKKISESENTVIDESNYSGNPLVVQFESIFRSNLESHAHSMIKHLNQEYDLYPLSESIGRKLLFMCSTIKNSLNLPYIAICHGKNPKQQVLLGAFKQEKNIRMKIMNLGSVLSMEKLPKMHSLKEALLAGFSFQNYIKPNITAHYDFLGYDNDENSLLVPVKDAKLSFDCSWSEAHSLLEPFPPECICIAKMNTVLGDDETGAYNKFKELRFLKALQQNVINDVMTWVNCKSTGSVMEEVKDLINEEKLQKFYEELHESKLDLDHIQEIILEERVPLYFTDKLWLLMKNCCSLDEMAKAIKYVYEATNVMNIQPSIHGKDLSTISKDIISMIDNQIVSSNITPQNAGKLILEIGIEKMRKDYKQIFVGLELVPQELFNHFVQHDLLSSESISGLEKLHSVLELAIICVKQLHLPKNILSEFVRNALKHYTLTDKVDVQHVFQIHVPTIYARPLLNQMRPTMWELSLLSSDKNVLKQNVHRFLATATPNNVYAPQNYDPRLMLQGASYVYLHGEIIVENECLF